MNRGALFAALARRMACFSTALLLLLGASSAYSATIVWNNGKTGNWDVVGTNGWAGAAYPNAVGDVGQYLGSSAGTTTLNLSGIKVGSLQKTNTSGGFVWTIAADANNDALTMDNGASSASITSVNNGGITVNVPLLLNSDLAVSTAASASNTNIILNGAITGSKAVTLSANNTGTTGTFASTITVADLNNGGAVTVNGNIGTNATQSSKTVITSIGSNVTSLTKAGTGELQINGGTLSATVTGDSTQIIKKISTSSSTLTVSADNSATFNGLWLTGTNAGTQYGVLRFDQLNAIGSGTAKYQVATGGLVAAGYAIDQSFLDRMSTSSVSAVIALATNSSNNLALGALTTAIVHLGAIGTVTYSGTLSNTGTTYYLGSGGGRLIISGTNAFSGGAKNLLVGNTNMADATEASSVTEIAATQNYTGTTQISSGILSTAYLANGGSDSGIGKSANTATNLLFAAVINGPQATLEYTGTGANTDRLFSLMNSRVGGAIVNNGSGALNFTNNGTIVIDTGNSTQLKTVTLGGSNTANNTFAPKLADVPTATAQGAVSFVKQDAGKWILTNANTYTGTTTVNGGTLVATNASSLGGATGGAVTVAGGAALEYAAAADAQLILHSTLGITGGTGSSTTLGGSIGSTATSAEINVTGAINGTAGSGTSKVNIYGISGVTPSSGTYTLLHSGVASTLSTALTATPALGLVYNNTNFTVGSLAATTTDLTATITSASALSSAYWTGTSASGITKVWAVSDGNSTSNWASSSGGAVQGLIPSAVDVTIVGTTVNATNSTLGANMTVKSLTIADTTNGMSLNGDGSTLTITPASSSAGITVNSGVPASSIGANVALGAAQTWTNNSTNNLTVSGIVSGAFALTKAGTGTVTLSGPNTYTGTTTVSAGTLALGNNLALQNSVIDTTGAGVIDATGSTTPTFGGLTGSKNLASLITTGLSSVTSLTLNNSGTITYSGVIANGAMALTKTGAGALTLSGANTYTGTTTVSAGSLKAGVTSVANTSGAFGNNSAISFANVSGAILDITGYNTQVGSLTGGGTTGGSVTLGSATLTTGGDNTSPAAYAGVISGASGALTKIGSGTQILSGTNTYGGKTTVANGTLSFSAGNATSTASQPLGANAALDLGVATTSSGILNYSGTGAATLAKNINALGNGGDTIQNSGTGALTLSGSLVKNNTKLTLSGGSNGIIVTGVISGGTTSNFNSDLNVTAGTTTINTVGTYYGPTNIYNAGTLVNGAAGVLPAGTVVTIGASGDGAVTNTYNLGGFNQTIAALNSVSNGGSTNVNTVTNTGTSTLTLSGVNSDSTPVNGTFSGVIGNGTGTTSLTVTGGTQTLSGTNSYTGATTVSAGTLLINGSTSAGSAVAVSSGATLGGSGTVNGATTLTGATIGTSPSTLTLSNTLTSTGASTLASGSTVNVAGAKSVTSGTLLIEGTLGGSGSTSVSAGAYIAGGGTVTGALSIGSGGFIAPGSTSIDTLTTNGILSLDSSATYQWQLNSSGTPVADKIVANGLTLASGSVFNFADLGSGTIALTTVFVAIDNTSVSPISGTFSGLGEGATFTVGANRFQASYVGGSGNDFTLTVVPEPTTWALLAFSLTTVVVLRRRRNS